MAEYARGTRTADVPDIDIDIDIARVLIEQHEQIRALCSDVTAVSTAAATALAFEDLRALLTIHEAAERAILRPRSRATAGEAVAAARDTEEKAIMASLADLESVPITSEEFHSKFASFARLVAHHMDAEEREEFPRMLIHYDAAERSELGRLFVQAESLVPTRLPRALANSSVNRLILGPLAALVGHAKDLF